MTREEAIEILWQYDVDFEPHPAEKIMHAIDMAIEALSADVVRCKDCRHYKKINPRAKSGMCYKDIVASAWKDDGFCSRGERREE